ncbi:MAG: CoxG family protein [Salinigranum sp.]
MPEVTRAFTIRRNIGDTWAFFNSPEDIAACVPGCESVEQLDENTFNAAVGVKVGYTSLTFDTVVEITDRTEPTSMEVEGTAEPSGRMPGSARVEGRLDMDEDGEDTSGEITIEFAIRGRLGSLGESAFTHKSEEITEQFLENVRAELEGEATA